MNTTTVNGVLITQGDEVKVSDNKGFWRKDLKAKFLIKVTTDCSFPFNVTVEKEDGSIDVQVYKYIRPLPKKKRVPLEMQDIVERYWNGAVRFKGDTVINKIVHIERQGVYMGASTNPTVFVEYSRLDNAEITPGPDANGQLIWHPCSKEVEA